MLSRLAAIAGLVLSVTGCTTFRAPEPAAEATPPFREVLLPVSALPVDLLLRQRVSIRWSDGEESFEAVLQKRDSQLLLLGLGPMNAVGFSLSLDEAGVHFENRSGRPLPFEPERILADVQRVFYPWIESGGLDDDGAGCRNCRRQASRGGFEVEEQFADYALELRRFRLHEASERVSRGGAKAEAEILVRYERWHVDGVVPLRATLTNGFFDYVLTIDTSSVERLSRD